MNNKNIVWHQGKIAKEAKTNLLGYKNKVLWFTGLSGSGKSTIAHELEKHLHEKKKLSVVLDGDNIRHGLNSDLGFSKENRIENIRRIAETAKLFYQTGIFVVVSFISPYRQEREFARTLIGKDFIEIFVETPLNICEKRDTKGLYKKAKNGEISDFTGISAPYEIPLNPEIVIKTEKTEISNAVEIIYNYLMRNRLYNPENENEQ